MPNEPYTQAEIEAAKRHLDALPYSGSTYQLAVTLQCDLTRALKRNTELEARVAELEEKAGSK